MKLEFDLCPTFLVGMSVKVMIFTHPLNLEVKSLLVHTDREREAYYLNPQKSDKSVQLLQGGWNWDGVVRFPNPLVFGSQSQSQAGTLSRMGGQCLLVATEKISNAGADFSNLGPLAISHTAHPRSVFPLGRLAHPGNILVS